MIVSYPYIAQECSIFHAYKIILFYRYMAMTTVDEASGWYGGSLLGDQDESSETYQHYAELIQVGIIQLHENLILD